MSAALLARADLQAAACHFVLACAASVSHSRLAARSLRKYGAHGPLISGSVRDHFPEPVRDTLRDLAREVTRQSNAAYACRPPRVRLATMRALGRAVAARDGSGYYGPRP